MADDEKLSDKAQWNEYIGETSRRDLRGERTTNGTKVLTDAEANDHKLSLAMMYNCDINDITIRARRIIDPEDVDYNQCVIVYYSLKSRNMSGDVIKEVLADGTTRDKEREIFTIRSKIPDHIQMRR